MYVHYVRVEYFLIKVRQFYELKFFSSFHILLVSNTENKCSEYLTGFLLARKKFSFKSCVVLFIFTFSFDPLFQRPAFSHSQKLLQEIAFSDKEIFYFFLNVCNVFITLGK